MSYIRSEIERMRGYVSGEQPQVGKFIKLNTNENPYPCSPKVTQAIEAALHTGLGRYPDALATAFRVRAGEVLGVDPESILCGNGSDDILTIVTRALVGQGDLIRLPCPSYVLYKTLADIQGARTQQVKFQADWSLPDGFGSAEDKLRLVFLPNPNSPSGTMISPDEILQIAQRLPCPLLVDEAYADFADQNCLSLVAKCDKIMVSRTLSKSYALAGLRFGFIVAQPKLIEQFRKVKDSYNCDTLSIAGATAAIDDQTWLEDNRITVIRTRERLTDQMRELGFDSVPSQANFVWNPHSSLPVQPLYEALKRNRILVRYMNYPEWGDGLRISVGTDMQIDACLTVLKSCM